MFFGDTEEGDGKKPGEEDLDNAKFVNNAEFKCPGARGAGGAGGANDNTILRNTSRRYLGEECIPVMLINFSMVWKLYATSKLFGLESSKKMP